LSDQRGHSPYAAPVDVSRFPGAASPMRDMFETHDWSGTPLGPPGGWPQSLTNAVGLMLPAMAQIVLFWGPDYVALYNDAYAPSIGNKHPQALGRPARENWSELWDDLEPLLASVRDTGETVFAKNRPFHINRHGYDETVWFDISYSAVPDERGGVGGVLCIVSETTERMLADQRVRESEAFNRRILSSSNDCIKVLSLDVRLESMSPGGLEVMEIDDFGAIRGAYWPDLWGSEERPLVEEAVAEALAGRTGRFEGFCHTGRGTLKRWDVIVSPITDEDGRIEKLLSISRDVSAQHAAQVALRESEERLRMALAAGQLGDWLWDVETDMIHFSPETARLFGVPEGPVISWKDLGKLIHPDDVAATYAAVSAAVEERRDYAIEYRLRRPGEAWLWVAATGRPIYHKDGRPKGVIGVVQDISARKRVDDELRELNQSLEARIAAAIAEREQAEEALRQSQKMEAVGQLTGGIAHDFNNLLTIITGNVDAARRHIGDEGPDRAKRALANALVGAERAAVLTQRLLAFSRRQPLNPRPIDPNRLVNSMSELLHRTLGETIAVETVLAAGLWRVEADPNQLENAILNLAVNARDAMQTEGSVAADGKLTIETANTHIDRDYATQNAGAMPGQYVVICVSDTGCGMDAETLARAIEPFFTTKEVGKGTGLGLSMVYGFVKQSGGHFKIYSEEGQGTTIRIYLPRLLAEEAEEEARVDVPVPEGTRDETILVCEDDDDVRAYTVEVLRELGYRVLEAHDGASALRLLERQEGRVDLLFTDVVLPGGMTGAIVAQEARKLRPDLRILFTTGYARNAIVHHGRLDPGVELLTKPFAYADLAARVRDMLDRG